MKKFITCNQNVRTLIQNEVIIVVCGLLELGPHSVAGEILRFLVRFLGYADICLVAPQRKMNGKIHFPLYMHRWRMSALDNESGVRYIRYSNKLKRGGFYE